MLGNMDAYFRLQTFAISSARKSSSIFGATTQIFSLVRPPHHLHQSLTHHISFVYFHGSYKESANFFYKGQTTGQIQLASCFYMADELRMVFMFLNGWGKKNQEHNFNIF